MPPPQSEIGNTEPSVALQAAHLSCRFGDVVALDDVSIHFHTGEVHAILGENGAGKSTFAKILAGELLPSSGLVCGVIGGETVQFSGVKQSRAAGVRLVHQNLSLVEALTVAENFVLEMPSPAFFPDLAELCGIIEAAAADQGLCLKGNELVARLSMSERQWLEILRALYLGTKVLILDEPTSLLSPLEADRLLAELGKLAAQGRTVILITHKLNEVFQHTDRTSILRNGKLLRTDFTANLTRDDVIAMLSSASASGAPAGFEARAPGSSIEPPGRPVLQLRSVSVLPVGRRPLLKNATIDLYGNRITGVAGVAGNGQTELAEVAAGIRKPTSGQVEASSPTEPERRYIPADRYGTGTCPHLSLLENLAARLFGNAFFAGRFCVDWQHLRKHAELKVSEFRIKARDLSDTPQTISGGNLQKVILARELEGPPDVLVAHNPTSGLDISTSEFIRGQLRAAADRGAAILLISDDLDELVELADEIHVLYENRIVGTLTKDACCVENVARLMTGGDS